MPGNGGKGTMSYVYLAVAILAEVIGTSLLKATEGFTRPLLSAVVVACYALAFLCLSWTLKDIPVGISYAVWSGAGIVLITLITWITYREALDAPALTGIGLIVAGVVVINLFSRSVPH